MAAKRKTTDGDNFAGSHRKMRSGIAPLHKFKPWPDNPRTHPADELALLSELLKTYDPDQPIVVDEDWWILKGHGRRDASLLARLTDFPYVQRLDLSEAEKIAMRIEDNQVALLAGWNKELVVGAVHRLQGFGYAISRLGFPELQLRAYGISVGNEGAGDPEATPEPPKAPVSKLGDIWILGDHRLLCGDATSESDVAACLDGAKPHLLVSDAPYGVDYDANWRNERDRANGKPYGASAVGKVNNDHQADWRKAWALFDGDVIYAWSADLRSREVIESLESCGFVMRAQIIWVKDRLIISRGDYHFMHEPCWYAVRKGKTGHWAADRKQTTVWNIAHLKSDTGHSTQKPIECMKRPMENNSKVGDFVYEPFCGSGTSIIAAEMTGRKCLAIEIDQAYVDVAVLRWQTFTGKIATLEKDGRSFDAVKAARAKGAGTRRRGSGSRPAQPQAPSPG